MTSPIINATQAQINITVTLTENNNVTISSEIQKIEESLNQLRGKEYISESTIDFFQDILKAQCAAKNKFKENSISISLADSEISEKLRQGIPLICWEDIPPNETLLADLFLQLCNILKNHQDSETEEIQKIIDSQTDGNLNIGDLIRKLSQQDSDYFHTVCNELGLNKEVVVFLTLSAAKPFFEAIAPGLRDRVADDKWLKNYCPMCGSSAQLSTLDKKSGQRYLYCTLCSSHWRYMRLKCSFCGDEQAGGQKFLAEEQGPYRIDLCEKCKRYIKTLDERKLVDSKEIIPSIEDLATMYLDMLAEKEGYERSWFLPPSVEDVHQADKNTTLH